MGMAALAVIRQNLDDTALIDTAVTAAFHHQLQLRFQRHQASDPLLDFD